jgi:hypothetical protein
MGYKIFWAKIMAVSCVLFAGLLQITEGEGINFKQFVATKCASVIPL